MTPKSVAMGVPPPQTTAGKRARWSSRICVMIMGLLVLIAAGGLMWVGRAAADSSPHAIICPLSAMEFAIHPDDAEIFDRFGLAVAVDGNTYVVGAPTDTTEAGAGAGSAYVFARNGTNWVQQAKLLPHDPEAGDEFGYAIDISGDTVVVGSVLDDARPGGWDDGSAYVFVRNGTDWIQQAKLVGDPTLTISEFGFCVAIDGDTIAIGEPFADYYSLGGIGSVHLFVRSGTNWTLQTRLFAGDLPSPRQEYFQPLDHRFGWAVDLEGDRLVVGAYRDDTPAGTESGSVYLFERFGTNWVQQAKLTASDAAPQDRFGSAVSLHGDTLVVGAQNAYSLSSTSTNTGSVYVFTRVGTNWLQQAKLTPSDGQADARFGHAVAIKNDLLLIGARAADTVAGTDAGAAYLFRQRGTTWFEQARLTSDQSWPHDWFGFAVALQGETALISAPRAYGAEPYDHGWVHVWDFDPASTDAICRLLPWFATNDFGNVQTILATVGADCVPQAGVPIQFAIVEGPNTGQQASAVTDERGQAEFSYLGGHTVGTDLIQATGSLAGQSLTGLARIVWLPTNQPPVAVCRDLTTTLVSACQLTLAPTDIDQGSYDPDGGELLYQLDPPGPYALGIHTVTLTVTDARGARDSCPGQLHVRDGVPPTIVCPPDVTAAPFRGYPATSVSFNAPLVDDDCGLLSVTCTPESDSVFPIGTNTVTCTAVDVSYNTNTCQFLVIVRQPLPSPPDLAVTHLRAPRRAPPSTGALSRPKLVKVKIQNHSQFPETIATPEMLAEFVNLKVESLGECDAPVAVLSPKTLSQLPRTLKPRQKFVVRYEIYFPCVNDPLQGPGHEDYRFSVHLNRAALDGFGDEAPHNDRCPRPSIYGNDGCGSRDANGDLGADVFTDLVSK